MIHFHYKTWFSTNVSIWNRWHKMINSKSFIENPSVFVINFIKKNDLPIRFFKTNMWELVFYSRLCHLITEEQFLDVINQIGKLSESYESFDINHMYYDDDTYEKFLIKFFHLGGNFSITENLIDTLIKNGFVFDKAFCLRVLSLVKHLEVSQLIGTDYENESNRKVWNYDQALIIFKKYHEL